MPERAISLLGIATLIGIAILLSTNRRAISLRIVASAFALQFAIAAFVLRFPLGQRLIEAASGVVQAVIN